MSSGLSYINGLKCKWTTLTVKCTVQYVYCVHTAFFKFRVRWWLFARGGGGQHPALSSWVRGPIIEVGSSRNCFPPRPLPRKAISRHILPGKWECRTERFRAAPSGWHAMAADIGREAEKGLSEADHTVQSGCRKSMANAERERGREERTFVRQCSMQQTAKWFRVRPLTLSYIGRLRSVYFAHRYNQDWQDGSLM